MVNERFIAGGVLDQIKTVIHAIGIPKVSALIDSERGAQVLEKTVAP
jgi:hypothetical protein